MLEPNNPEIDVDDIMSRIREKVRMRSDSGTPARSGTGSALPEPDALAWSHVDQRLARAQEVAAVGASLPEMSRLRGLTRAVAGAVAKGFLRVAQLITRDQRVFNAETLGMLRTFSERMRDEEARASALRAEMAALRGEMALSVARIEARVEVVEGGAETGLGQVRSSLSLQERRVALLLEEARRRLPEAMDAEQLEVFADELPRAWDATYLAFEDEFRGSREEIIRRARVYVPKLREAGAGTEERPVLDVGCGRGELLELLRAEGLQASGVDANRLAVDQCRQLGLAVRLEDAFAALDRVSDGSLGALTAIHVVEHLPFPLLLKLIDEALRVLRPGGIVIFETPNPKNVFVGSSNFYLDPTHRNPVHPETLQYLMRVRGLVRIETMMLHPWPAESRLPDADSELARRFNEYFYGPQDYAVLGHRT